MNSRFRKLAGWALPFWLLGAFLVACLPLPVVVPADTGTAPEEGAPPEEAEAPAEEPATEEAAAEEAPEAPAAEGAEAPQVGEVVARGLNAPMGVYLADDGTIWVVDSGTGGDEPIVVGVGGEPITATLGMTARVLQIAPDGTQTEVATLPSLLMGEEASGGSRVILVDDVPYVTVGFFVGDPEDERPPLFGAVVRLEDGEVVELTDTWALEAAENPDGFIYESHPYGLAAAAEGTLWVADAGANDLLKINRETGEIEDFIVMPGVEGLPFPNPNRGGAQQLDPVPTGVVVGEDGILYVSFLPGFPPIPGAKVVTVDPESGKVSDYATGPATLTDLRMGPDGNLYGVQIFQFSEEGPLPNTGAIIRIREGEGSEVVVDSLPFPTSVDFDEEGNAYITTGGVGAPGSGAVIRVDGLTEMEGEPLPAPAAPPAG